MFQLICAAALFVVIIVLIVMDDERTSSAMFGVAFLAAALGMNLTFGIFKLVSENQSHTYDEKAKLLIEKCEATLPRNQNCEIEMRAIVKQNP